MATYRLQITPISRADGHSSVAAAAYRAGERILDERTNEVHNHSRRKDVTHSEIVLPSEVAGENMDWARNRASLWNAAENAETRKTSRVAREIQVNLPHELPAERRVELARAFSQEVATHYKVAVDLAVHDPRPSGDPRNYHAHLLMTTREVSPDGLGAKAGLELSTHERSKLGLPSTSQEYTAIRERWATMTNEALKEANIEARVDHRSLAEQGIDREPKPHIPFAAFKIERAGKHSDVAESIRADYNARVRARQERIAAHEPAHAATTAQPTPDRAPPTLAEAQPPPIHARSTAALAQPAPDAPPKTLEDIRREARENWLKMRSQQSSATPGAAPTAGASANASANAVPTAGASANPSARVVPTAGATPSTPSTSIPTRTPDNDHQL